jgi:hypothetical protein
MLVCFLSMKGHSKLESMMIYSGKLYSNGLSLSLYTISLIVPCVPLNRPQSGSKFFPVSSLGANISSRYISPLQNILLSTTMRSEVLPKASNVVLLLV